MNKSKPTKDKKAVQFPDLFQPRRIRIKIVGLGGGGCSIVSELSKTLTEANFFAADTDARTFKKMRKRVKPFVFGQNLTGGMGTGCDAELAEKAAEAEKEKIAKMFKDQDIVVLVGCLGGGAASGAGPVFARLAREQKCISVGIFTLPFSFEGEKKCRAAQKAAGRLKEELSGIIVAPNEKIFQLVDKKVPLKKALSILNGHFASFLSGLFDVILKPNLINIDFADLRAILKDRGNFMFFNQKEGLGANRAEEVVKNIFQNFLLEQCPSGVKRILFNVAGGKDLKIKEAEMISSAIVGQNPRAKIIFGLSETKKGKNKIALTLLAVGREEKKQADVPAGEDKTEKIAGKKQKSRKTAAKEKNGLAVRISRAPKKNGTPSLPETEKERLRRTALDIHKEEEETEKREWATEPDWEVPAFLRKKIQ
ncbi:MAG: cell division FtsZ family protein [Patescibacteria group bacterium]|nr:cell division FtsZ family protein [Patescibacteria group bacterium]